MPSKYPWYDVVEGLSLEQGDILEDFPVLVPQRELGDTVEEYIPSVEEHYNLVVMTQTSDIINDKVRHILLCPVWTEAEIEGIDPSFFGSGIRNKLLKYQVVGFHPINKCQIPSFERPWRIVQFQRVFEVDIERVMEHVRIKEKHIRLLPPFREHLSQHFARFFMRVGLPSEIDTS